MSHDSNSPEADREFNELYRAAQGTSGSHAPGNTSLNSIKNNPSRDGLTVKHSDFFVDEINKTLVVANSRLNRSEETEVTVTFTGARSGFTQEIMVNPNNFEWYVSSESADLLRITKGVPASHPNKEDWGQSGDTEYGAFKIRIKNIAPCAEVDRDAYIRCKFKDDFNETIGASKGYNTELTGKITILKNAMSLPMRALKNLGNQQIAVAYDNELEQYQNGEINGQNLAKYTNPANIEDRELTSLLDNNDDLIIRGSLNGPDVTLSHIYGVDVIWQKYMDDSNEWVDVVLPSNQSYDPYGRAVFVDQLKTTDNPQGNAGQLLKSFKFGTTSRASQPQLNVQGTHGTGLYRAKVTVSADTADPYNCTFMGDQVQVNIRPRIPQFTVSGQGYGCHGQPTTLTINPVKMMRPGSNLENLVDIHYTVYRVNSSGLKAISTVIKNNDANSFDVSINGGDGFYTVRALMIPKGWTGAVRPGDNEINGYGLRYSTTRVDTGYNTQDNAGTIGAWYNNAAYRQITLPPVATPEFTSASGRYTMSGSKMYWRWFPINTVAGSDVTYQYQIQMKGQTGGWYVDTNWTNTSNNGKDVYHMVNNTPESTSTGLPNARVRFSVRAVVVPPTTGLAPGDTPVACYSEIDATDEVITLTCDDLIKLMPVPTLNITSPGGGDRPTLEPNYDGTSWVGGNPTNNPSRRDFVNITQKLTGDSDSTYTDVTQSIAVFNGVPASRIVTIGGLTYIDFGSVSYTHLTLPTKA